MTSVHEDLIGPLTDDVLGHLERSVRVPALGGLQAQGDIIVIPLELLGASVRIGRPALWRPVPRAGVEVLRAESGGNPHTLFAEPGTCRWLDGVPDAEGLALGAFDASSAAYLLHPEHTAVVCAPGAYVIRRQREHDGRRRVRLVAD